MIKGINQCDLFKNLSTNDLERLFKNLYYSITNYQKNQIIAYEGEQCKRIGIILKGKIGMQNFLQNGEITTIGRFGNGKMFGEVLVFGDHDLYPATIIALEDCEILYIENQHLLTIFQDYPVVLHNFLNILTKRIFYLNNRVKLMNQITIRSKIAFYLIDQYRNKKSNVIYLGMSKEKLAEYLNIQRPSLSRELIYMKQDGLIDYNRDQITLLAIEQLEDCIK